MESKKTIGVLTSGGDAPGMNAAVRAVVRSGIQKGFRVLGIKRGYTGLISGDVEEMELRSVSDIIHKGGTVLYTARCPEFKTEEGMQTAINTCKQLGISGLVVIGGDGSFRGATDLSKRGIPCIGIPGTIDNDIPSSDYTIGFDTALNTVTDLVDKLRDTSQSHDRCSVVEVMGRMCGDIALRAGVASGATTIIVPEVPFDFQRDIIDRFNATQNSGKKHFIVIIAEGVGGSEELTKRIEKETGIVSRLTVLGYVQRGGSPTVYDRVMASRMGDYAVELLSRGVGDRVVVYKNSKVTDFDIQEALKMKKEFNQELYDIARRISI